MTFAARLLIRFATLVPDAIDLRATGRDIEALAQILHRGPGPGAMLAEQIQQVLRRARSKRVLPPPSRASSPRRERARASSPRREGEARKAGGVGMTAVSSAEQSEGHGEHATGSHGANGTGAAADVVNVGFEFLNDFSFPEDLFNGNSLNDDDVSLEYCPS